MTKTIGYDNVKVADGVLHIYTDIRGAAGMARLNQTFNLTNYKYVKAKIKAGGGVVGQIGIGTTAGITALASLTKYSGELTAGVVILDISSVSGNYYIYLTAQHKTSGNTTVLGGAVQYEELFLTNA